MKRFLSYIWPITHRFSSEINGPLEVTYINGKKVLDTQNANYSYGSLQKILEFGLSKVDLKSVENILVLGLGGGSVIHSLRNTFDYTKNIVAVEIDPEIIKIAKEEFEIFSSENLQIMEGDAYEYVKNTNEKFQLIIIDLFIDLEVPPVFFGKDFCKNVSKLLDKEGSLIFNAGVNIETQCRTAEIIANFGNGFQFRAYNKVNRTNSLLIGKKR